MNAIIEARGLSRHFRGVEAVHNLTFAIPEGRICAFLGPNGAGKTTTIKMLMNLIEPGGGTCSVMGIESRQLRAEHWQHIGYVSENQQLHEWMTVRGLLEYLRPFYRTWDREFEARLLADFVLPEKRKIKHLSRGMKMKLAMLSALAFRPRPLPPPNRSNAMNLLFHQIWKDIRQTRWSLLAFLGLPAIACVRALFHGDSSSAVTYLLGAFLRPVAEMFLICRLIHADPLTGSSAFWMTHPISRPFLLASKAAFFGCFILIPLAAMHLLAADWMIVDLPLWDTLRAELWLAFAGLTLACLTTSLVQSMSAALAALVALSFLTLMLRILDFPVVHFPRASIEYALAALIIHLSFASRKRILPWILFSIIPILRALPQ